MSQGFVLTQALASEDAQVYETNIQAVITDVTMYSYANYLISNCCIVSLY